MRVSRAYSDVSDREDAGKRDTIEDLLYACSTITCEDIPACLAHMGGLAGKGDKEMSTTSDIHDIKRRLQQMKPAEVNEVKDFVEFLSRKDFQGTSEKKITKLKGIWKDIGFEKLDLEKEIKEARKKFDEGVLRRSERWTM